MEILKVENLSKVYGKGESKVVALDHVSFSVKKGEFVAIVGLLKKSNREYNQTILMITHNMEIAKLADRILMLEDGKIVKEI